MTVPKWKPRHRAGCDRPKPVDQITRGGRLRRSCPSCATFWWPEQSDDDGPAPVAEPVLEPVLEPPPAPPARLVCREHGHGVTWKGRGCPDCEAEARARAALRRRRPRPAPVVGVDLL